MRIKGVSQHHSGRWVAKITRDMRIHHLGYFATEAEAQRAVLEFDIEWRRRHARDFERRARRQLEALA